MKKLLLILLSSLSLTAVAQHYDTNAAILKGSSKYYVDLGLPSGTLWKNANEDSELTFYDAKRQYGSSMPTQAQWKELIKECQWIWVDPGWWSRDEEGEYWHIGDDPYFLIKGKNGNFISLPLKGYVDVEEKLCVGCGGIGGIAGYYYSSTENEKNEFMYLDIGYYSGSAILNWDLKGVYHLSIRLVK